MIFNNTMIPDFIAIICIIDRASITDIIGIRSSGGGSTSQLGGHNHNLAGFTCNPPKANCNRI